MVVFGYFFSEGMGRDGILGDLPSINLGNYP